MREIAESLYEGQFDDFQFGMLTDWAYKIADARLGWRRRRIPTRQTSGPVAASTKCRIPATSRSTAETVAHQAQPSPPPEKD